MASPAAALARLADDPAPLAAILDYELLEQPQGDALRDALVKSDLPTLLLISPGQPGLQAFAGR